MWISEWRAAFILLTFLLYKAPPPCISCCLIIFVHVNFGHVVLTQNLCIHSLFITFTFHQPTCIFPCRSPDFVKIHPTHTQAYFTVTEVPRPANGWNSAALMTWAFIKPAHLHVHYGHDDGSRLIDCNSNWLAFNNQIPQTRVIWISQNFTVLTWNMWTYKVTCDVQSSNC